MTNNVIGKGKFGKVIEAEDYKGDKFALKVIQTSDLSFVEVDILSRVKSPYLIRSLEDSVLETDMGRGLVLELKEKDLSQLPKDISGGQMKRIIMSLVYGLECLHKQDFLHLDIKPKNCLYDYKNNLYTGYLSDFGFSMRCRDCFKGIVRKRRIGTARYVPYEFLIPKKEYNYTDKSDVWSLGLTILVILGFPIKDKIKSDDNKNILHSVKVFWDETNIDNLINTTLNQTKLSDLDRIDLFEMLQNMLKKSPTDRISSKDFSKLRFYNKNTLENSCFTSKPKEIFYIPYTSSYVIRGIQALKKFFKKEENGSLKLECFFLAIEIFIRIMAITPLEISDKYLEICIQKSFFTSLKYYKELNLTKEQEQKYQKYSYDTIRYLKGDIAPNRYFYKAKYIEDLVLVSEVVLENYNLISLYNYLDSDNLWNYFRVNYNYKNIPVTDIETCEEFFNLRIPGKNSEAEIDNDRSIFTYSDLKSSTQILGDSVSSISQYRETEKRFREEIVENVTQNLSKLTEKQKMLLKQVYLVKDVFKFYRDNFKNTNLSKILYNKIPNLNYGIIEEDIFGKFNFTGIEDKKYIIYKTSKDCSLIVVEKREGRVIHYYSNFIEKLKDYFEKENYTYSNNNKIQMIKFGKIEEVTIIFIIYYNLLTSNDEYNTFFIEDKTLKTIMSSAISFTPI